MSEEIRYALIMPNGQVHSHMIRGWRKGVEEAWIEIWDTEKFPKMLDWRYWYNCGYRIKKVKIKITLL